MIAEYLRELGARLRAPSRPGWQKILCPFHEDTHPSATVNVSAGRFYCFVCGISEDTIGLIRLREGVSFAEAKQEAETRFGAGDSRLRSSPDAGALLPVRTRNTRGYGARSASWRSQFA